MWVLSRSLFPSMTRQTASIAVQLALLLRCAAGFTPVALPTVKAQASRPASTSHSNCNNIWQKLAANQSFRPSWQAPSIGSDIAMAAAVGSSSSDLELKSENACFGGRLLRYVHQSVATKTPMTFTVFLPGLATKTPVPVRVRRCSRGVFYWA